MLAAVVVGLTMTSLTLSFAPQTAAPTVRDAPARDAAPDQQNTASIRGRVTSLESNRPLRRARIVLSGAGLSSSRTVSTNSDGRFEIRDLPAGRYTLRVERSGYLPLAYGQRRPGESPKPLELSAQQSVENVDFALPRSGVISGRVLDELGEPMSGVDLWTMRVQYFKGARRLSPIAVRDSHTRTDEGGLYRLIGLPPGEFVVMAQSRETWPLDKDPTQTFSYAPSYYPGTAAAAAAQRVKVTMGQEVGGIDFSLVPVRASKVSGTVMNAQGIPVAGESVSLSREIIGPMGAVFPSSNVGRTGSDGRFTIANVQPGEYRLVVRAPAVGDERSQEAQQVLEVTGTDLDLVIVTGAGGTLSGRVETDDGSPLPSDRLLVRLRMATSDYRIMGNWASGNGQVDKNGAFELNAIFGKVLLSIVNLPGDWTLKNILLDRRDIGDEPLEVAHGAAIAGLRIVLTNRPTLLRGALTDEKLQPAEGTVVIFPEERAHWIAETRRIRSARPDQKGEFAFKGLPAGKYLITALDYVEEDQWNDPEFLDGVKSRAERVSLADAENKRVDLILRK